MRAETWIGLWGGDPRPGLLEAEEPSARWVTLTALADRPPDDPEVEAARAAVLDDAGTGFGTLTYLQNLPFSQLKIDMAFVRGILTSETDAGIVRSLVVIANNLGLDTVAAGVEHAEIIDELRKLGVDHAQGYYLGKPGPIDAPLD